MTTKLCDCDWCQERDIETISFNVWLISVLIAAGLGAFITYVILTTSSG